MNRKGNSWRSCNTRTSTSGSCRSNQMMDPIKQQRMNHSRRTGVSLRGFMTTTAPFYVLSFLFMHRIEAFQLSLPSVQPSLQGRNCNKNNNNRDNNKDGTSTTVLRAVPTLIIAPMLKKMKEENAKKRMPSSANREEAMNEAPGLRVGRDVWKWPPFWPYDELIFKTQTELDAMKNSFSNNDILTNPNALAQTLATSLGTSPDGTLAPPALPVVDDTVTEFDALKYWSEQVATERTNLDVDAIAKLKEHYEFYLPESCSILEFGASENSYIPESIQPTRHVGVSASGTLMESNPSLSQRIVLDLNKVNPGVDIDSDELRTLATNEGQFDVILMTNTVDYLSYPREVFRTAWYLLKPGGLMLVPFSGREATKNKFVEAQTKIWKDYNDDQHMWITGSFFQFSAGSGWENLLGFDISPESAKKPSDNPLLSNLASGKDNNLFVVQATKGFQYQTIEMDAIEESIRSLCWMLPVMEERDKLLLIPRLTRIYETTSSVGVQRAIQQNLKYLPTIYEALSKMDTFAFTFSMQAQMAADLISDEQFDGTNMEQILALKQGLGLRTPSPEFWLPVGHNTGAMAIEDKISLLAFIVPKFGSKNNPLQEASLQAFVTGLQPTYNTIRSKCPQLGEGDIQLLGTELLAVEILQPGKSTPTEYAQWLNSLTSSDFIEILEQRISLRVTATTEYEEYRIEKEEDKIKVEQYKRQYDEQIQVARMERSLIFNPKTQKMQIFDNPNKKQNENGGGNFLTRLLPQSAN